MRFSSLLCLGATLAILAPSVAGAQPIHPARTVHTLMESCQSEDPTILMRCDAYLGGIADSMDFLAAFQHVHNAALHNAKLTVIPFAICHKEPWTADSLRTTFLDWANKHQDRWQGDQYVAVVDALQEAMPCKK